jgi:hypothetical protein
MISGEWLIVPNYPKFVTHFLICDTSIKCICKYTNKGQNSAEDTQSLADISALIRLGGECLNLQYLRMCDNRHSFITVCVFKTAKNLLH